MVVVTHLLVSLELTGVDFSTFAISRWDLTVEASPLGNLSHCHLLVSLELSGVHFSTSGIHCCDVTMEASTLGSHVFYFTSAKSLPAYPYLQLF